MELFIQIRDGQPYEHPIFADNFREAFPHVDVENLPPEFARFVRVEMPSIGVYQVYEGVTYELIEGAYRDLHHVRAMTDQERAKKIANAMAEEAPEGWTFSEEYCVWVPPRPLTENLDAPGSSPNVIE